MAFSRVKLTQKQLETALRTLPGWRAADEKLHREYKFKDFIHAFGFMATSALAIEKMNHHPEWSNVWNMVRVSLSTHDAGGITEWDVELARTLDAVAEKLQ